MGESQNQEKNNQKLDSEWVRLLMEAKQLNLTLAEIRTFIHKTKESRDNS